MKKIGLGFCAGLLAIFVFVGFSALMPSFEIRHAEAQTASDTKLIPGSAGHIVSCTKSLPQLTWLQGNEMDLFLTSNQTFGASDNCRVIWNVERDYPTSPMLPTVTVHFFKRLVTPTYGDIACSLIAYEHGLSTDVVNEVQGPWTQHNDSQNEQNSLPHSMTLTSPSLISYPDGSQTWNNGAVSVNCDFGNDYVVTDIEWTESGAD